MHIGPDHWVPLIHPSPDNCFGGLGINVPPRLAVIHLSISSRHGVFNPICEILLRPQTSI